MGENILSKIARPYLIGAFIALAGLAVLLVQGVPWYWACVVAVGGYAVFAAVMYLFQKNMVVDYLSAAHDEIEETLRYSIVNHPLPLCLVNSDGVIAMTNEQFKQIFPQAKILKSTVSELIGEDIVRKLRRGDTEVGVQAAGRDFRVLASYVNRDVSRSAMVFFLDETDLRKMTQTYEEERLCYCYLIVDNYEDLLQASPDETRSIRAAAIEALVRSFADELEGSLLRYRSSAYQIIFSRKHYRKLAAGKFAVLDAARKLETDADFPASLSIGIGLGDDSPAAAEKYALYALDLARGRGGDQAVVKHAAALEYFGGRVQVIENRNKGKSRVMSHAIRQLIMESSNVIVMGHKHADIDSFGAACAMYRMAAAHDREACIVLNHFNHSLTDVHRTASESGNYRFAAGDEALRMIGEKTLLIIVDTHVPDMVDDMRLLGKTAKTIILDHHRKRENVIEGATLTYMEPNASSSSELVTEILQYDDSIRKIGKFEAEMLLGGIFIDTNSFSVKTGARTFEAAAWLRMNGAETTNVRAWLRSDMEDFRQRASITANAEFSKNGIAISRSDGKNDNASVVIAQAADELLDIKGIRASFVVGETTREVLVSARSLGDLNVQVLMEKFGGGGHLTMAAAQIKDLAIDEVIAKLKEYINEAEGENK
jgi:c-di-AMP phosphodiesterase-like protein